MIIINIVLLVVKIKEKRVLWTQAEKIMTSVGRKANWLNVSLIVIEFVVGNINYNINADFDFSPVS